MRICRRSAGALVLDWKSLPPNSQRSMQSPDTLLLQWRYRRFRTRKNSKAYSDSKQSIPAHRNPDALWSHLIHVVSVRHARKLQRIRGAMTTEFDYDLTPDQWEA